MAKMFQVYGIGQALLPVLPPPIPFENAPTSTQTNYEVGQLVYTPGPTASSFYLYAGGGSWSKLTESGSGPVQSVTGTANQILATPTTGDVVLSLIGPYTPANYTAHGVLVGEGSSSIVATAVGTDGQVLTGNSAADPAFAAIGTKSGLTAHGVLIAEGASAFAATAAGTAGQLLTSGGASADPTWTTATYPATVTAGALLVGTASNVVGSIADVATGQALMSGGVGVVPAYTGSPSFSGSVTAATSITATLGNITATNGNLVLNTAGNKIVSTSVGSGTSAGANSFGTVTLSSGTATVSTSAVTASSIIMLTRQSVGSSTALGILTVGTIMAGTSFVISAATQGTPGTPLAADVSVVGWMIIN